MSWIPRASLSAQPNRHQSIHQSNTMNISKDRKFSSIYQSSKDVPNHNVPDPTLSHLHSTAAAFSSYYSNGSEQRQRGSLPSTLSHKGVRDIHTNDSSIHSQHPLNNRGTSYNNTNLSFRRQTSNSSINGSQSQYTGNRGSLSHCTSHGNDMYPQKQLPVSYSLSRGFSLKKIATFVPPPSSSSLLSLHQKEKSNRSTSSSIISFRSSSKVDKVSPPSYDESTIYKGVCAKISNLELSADDETLDPTLESPIEEETMQRNREFEKTEIENQKNEQEELIKSLRSDITSMNEKLENLTSSYKELLSQYREQSLLLQSTRSTVDVLQSTTCDLRRNLDMLVCSIEDTKRKAHLFQGQGSFDNYTYDKVDHMDVGRALAHRGKKLKNTSSRKSPPLSVPARRAVKSGNFKPVTTLSLIPIASSRNQMTNIPAVNPFAVNGKQQHELKNGTETAIASILLPPEMLGRETNKVAETATETGGAGCWESDDEEQEEEAGVSTLSAKYIYNCKAEIDYEDDGEELFIGT